MCQSHDERRLALVYLEDRTAEPNGQWRPFGIGKSTTRCRSICADLSVAARLCLEGIDFFHQGPPRELGSGPFGVLPALRDRSGCDARDNRIDGGVVTTIAYTSNDDSIALNMGKIKKFKEIGLDTFSYFLQRVGIADQYRDDVMTAVMAAGNAVLTKWEQIFVEFDVPPHLIAKVRTHVSGLRLGSEF